MEFPYQMLEGSEPVASVQNFINSAGSVEPIGRCGMMLQMKRRI